jgi:hypothetical protein
MPALLYAAPRTVASRLGCRDTGWYLLGVKFRQYPFHQVYSFSGSLGRYEAGLLIQQCGMYMDEQCESEPRRSVCRWATFSYGRATGWTLHAPHDSVYEIESSSLISKIPHD